MMPISCRVDFDSTTLASATYYHRQNLLPVDFRDGARPMVGYPDARSIERHPPRIEADGQNSLLAPV